ncbi:MAG: hypothetical protein ACOYOQ_14335 [Microthrixaceae bacterium]
MMRRKVFSVQQKRPVIPFMAQRTVIDDGDEQFVVVNSRRWFSKGRNIVIYQTK